MKKDKKLKFTNYLTGTVKKDNLCLSNIILTV